MTLEQLLEAVPDYAQDLRLNLSTLLRQSELSAQQLWGAAVASAVASRNPRVDAAIESEAAKNLTPEALNAAKSAAAIMGMNNVYYRFLHLTSNPQYATIPARLRMNALRTHGVEQADFDLWCTAVSAIDNCPACVASHEKAVRERGLTAETILAAVRIAAVIHAVAAVFDARLE
ncbi:MAG: carboxymuconolactone decarboxylase family protein [Bryobacteraceae bacterium]|jgi:alkyl hydroperoxide reductase subunit D